MFGRRRRVAPVIQVSAPELSDEQIFELLHDKLAELIGERGQWTLVSRSADDTDVIFHGLKATQIATTLTGILSSQKAELRGERDAEPTALSWTPAPISVWAEPERATVAAPVQLPIASIRKSEQTRLVA
ncbi:hypothetical protein [Cryobacterium tagatosivorans]|uniref:hypothetical protein n=1 Tax=Cryobacterium tagatosivorans TaxID=1259199 RepID=UPI0010696B49|nr:hypothetical protein [Cryobacterium tagatosivorans]